MPAVRRPEWTPCDARWPADVGVTEEARRAAEAPGDGDGEVCWCCDGLHESPQRGNSGGEVSVKLSPDSDFCRAPRFTYNILGESPDHSVLLILPRQPAMKFSSEYLFSPHMLLSI